MKKNNFHDVWPDHLDLGPGKAAPVVYVIHHPVQAPRRNREDGIWPGTETKASRRLPGALQAGRKFHNGQRRHVGHEAYQ